MPEITSIIKYEGDNQTFIWKHPCEDFNTATQLIVHVSQEAVFFMNGQALDLFGPGRYTLETQNIPLVGKLLKATTGGETPFHCEVYFINKTEQMSIKWGTDSQVEYVEPTYKFPIKIGASGEMSLRNDDSCKLLVKVVGTETTMTQQALVQKLRGFLMAHIKPYLANLIREKAINIFKIDEHLQEMSKALHERLTPDFADYGIALERFFITTIVKPEDDRSYQKFKELHFRQYADIAEATLNQQRTLIEQETRKLTSMKETEAERYRLQQTGISRQEELGFEVARTMAGNEAVGHMINTGIGLSQMPGQPALPVLQVNPVTSAQTCANCGIPLPVNAKFCLECGQKIVLMAENEMLCPKCGSKTPKAKFCMECGTSLVNQCPKCDTEVPTGGKFCLNCGEKLR